MGIGGGQRSHFGPPVEIRRAYKLIYRSNLNISQALKKIEEEFELTPEIKHAVDFVKSSKRGIIK